MRVFSIAPGEVRETSTLPEGLPPRGFVWIACECSEFGLSQVAIQSSLNALTGNSLVDLHISDLLNPQLPSRFDYTSRYDILVFRRLTANQSDAGPAPPGGPSAPRVKRSGPPVLRRIDTSPVGFAVFDRVVLTVHPVGCNTLDFYAGRLLAMSTSGARSAGTHLPSSPADLMLRVINHMVDGYLDLRRLLTRHHNHLQQLLLDPRSRFNDWHLLLQARTGLHHLEDVCEDQRSAVQEWIDALDEWPDEAEADKRRERELLRVRSRDVLEHIERVLGHVRRLEQGAETVVQMHFSALSHRTNSIMRTLTVLTAIFLPLNLITGFFGMNFDSLPWVHSSTGIWLTVALMAAVALGLLWFFRRQRFLGRSAD